MIVSKYNTFLNKKCSTNTHRVMYPNRIAKLLLHFSFIMMIVGALFTNYTSQKGVIHLRDNGEKGESTIDLPFIVKLDHFEIDYFDGTTAPADFISHLVIEDFESKIVATVSLNNIYRYKGYRFCQSLYDKDYHGTTLSINYDPYGIVITYSSYVLLLISMIWLLVDKNGKFRRLLKVLGLITLLLLPAKVFSQRTMTEEEADVFGRISMYYNGRIVPIDTYAKDFTKKLTGKTHFKNYNAVQILSGYMFYYEDWCKVQLIKENSDDNIQEVQEKIQLMLMQSTGATLRIFPQGRIWYSSTDDLTAVDTADSLFIAKGFQLLHETLRNDSEQIFIDLLNKYSVYQRSRAEEGAISEIKTSLEILYNKSNITRILSMINLSIGILAFMMNIIGVVSLRKREWVKKVVIYQLVISLVILTILFGIRWFISGFIPIRNGYETMISVAWVVSLVSIIMRKRAEIIHILGLLLTGFTLLVSTIGGMNPQITQTMPILMSPWLSIHVSLLMLSYALLAIIMLNGVTAVVIRFVKVRESNMRISRLQVVSRVLLYPALFSLIAGIFVGAVWANISWGRYWGWDPKETWALITMIVYSLGIHVEKVRFLRNPLVFHIYTIVAFLFVIMTYFGVTWFSLGGMHSY